MKKTIILVAKPLVQALNFDLRNRKIKLGFPKSFNFLITLPSKLYRYLKSLSQ